MICFIVNIHICMLFITPQFNVFIYYAHACLFRLALFVYLLLKRAPRKISYRPIELPSQNKEFTYLLTYLLRRDAEQRHSCGNQHTNKEEL